MKQMCSWCHQFNDMNAVAFPNSTDTTTPPYCWNCGHRLDLARGDCDCVQCQREAFQELTLLQESVKTITDEEINEVESLLRLRAACLNWTGDPLKQPPKVVLAIVRQVMTKRL